MYQLEHPCLPDLIVSQIYASHVGVLLDRLSELNSPRIADFVLAQMHVADAQLGYIDLLCETKT